MADIVTGKDIARLDHNAFRSVMNAVITAETDSASVSLAVLNLTTRDTDPDGGVDGRLDLPVSFVHDLLGAGDTVIQYKSGKLTEAELKKEFAKSGVTSALKAGGRYVLFVGQDYVDATRKQREKTLKDLCKRKRVSFKKCRIVYGDQIARWVSRHLGVVIMPELDKGLPSFVTIENLAQSPNLRNPYWPDAARLEVIKQIRQFIRSPNSEGVIRIEGPAGVGKSRVLLEALNVPGLAHRSLYCANAEDPAAQQLIASLCNQQCRAIIVLDECDSERQQSLKAYSELTNGRIILVCAGVTDVLFQAPSGLSSVYMLLPLLDEDIRKILEQQEPGAPVEIVDTAVRLSGGYVKLAVFIFVTLLRARTLPLQDLAKIPDIRYFLKKFVSADTYKTLKVFSLLAKVGWRDDRRSEAEALATQLALPIPDMEAAVHRLREQGVIIERGFSLYVSPDLLAISAAAAMWEEKGPGLIRIIETLPGAGPKRQLLRRLATMHEHPTVIQAVDSLLGPNGLYKSIEDLDQKFLSEVFRFFASTLPPSALAVLERVISGTTPERLRSFNTGRREVIWAIESLLRWPETSLRAARVLVNLASSENESISNNATGVLETFFHSFLSGSPLPLLERLALADELLAEDGSRHRELAVKAAASALAFHESRMGGETDPISQRPYPQEWRPQQWGDLWEARRFALELLWKAAEGNDDTANRARLELLNSVSTLARDGQLVDAINLMKRFDPISDEERFNYLEAIHRIRRVEGLQLTSDQKELLETLLKGVYPDDLFDQIRRYTGKRTFFDYDLDGDGFANVDNHSAKLAERVFMEGLSDEGWEWLASPAAENVWPFGQKLGTIDVSNTFLPKLVALSAGNLNELLLPSYLSAKTQEARDDVLDEIAKLHEKLAFVTTWRGMASVRGGLRILSVMDKVPPEYLNVLRYGNWISPLPDDVKTAIIEKMLAAPETKEAGSSLVAHLALSDGAFFETHQELLWSALAINPNGVSAEWEWGQLARRAIEIDAYRSAELALLFLLNDDDVHLSSHPAVQSLAEATKRDAAKIWRLVGSALLRKTNAAFRLLLSLQHWYGELIPCSELIKWAKRYGRRGRVIASELIRVAAPLPERARELVIAFPDDDSLLGNFAGQLFSGSWVGTMSGHTEAILKKIELLETDPHPRIAAWASRLREGTTKQLERERLSEEDEEL